MKIAPDKRKHFLVGIGMGAVLQTLFFFLLGNGLSAVIFSFLFSCIIGYGFELYSKFTGKGHYEVMDAVAAVIGASIGIAAVLLLFGF